MIFTDIPQAPADPILGLTDAFKADPRADKVNLGVGIYKDEQGQTPILASVKQAETLLLECEQTKSYLGIDGVEAYNQGVLALLFGEQNSVLTAARAQAAQAPGGTGALRIAAEFLKQNTQSHTIWISNPTWANHRSIFQNAGLTIAEYRYYEPQTHGLDFDAMMTDLAQAQAGDVVLLHGCCHNPTGIDPTPAQWQAIAELCQEKQLLPLFDFAYQGFGVSIEQDAQGLRTVASVVSELLVASSFSKNFGLYNERVGAITLVTSDRETTHRAFSQIKRIIRSVYSNPPAHGALIVSAILSNPSLKAQWQQELAEMRNRIADMRQLFVDSLQAAGIQQDFRFIAQQNGMFSFSGLTKAQVEQLRTEHGVYIVGSGRISVAGMTKANMPKICQAIAAVL